MLLLRTSLLALTLQPCAGLRLARAGWSAANHEALQALLERPVPSAHGLAPVAAFDADGTLWAGDAYGAFASVLVRRGLLDGQACDAIEKEYAQSESSERRKWLVEGLKLFEGLRLEQLRDAAHEAWESAYGPTSGLRDSLRPEMADLVSCLREAGWRVLIVTASPAEAVLRGAQELGVPEGDILAVRLEARGGVCTGRPSPLMPLTLTSNRSCIHASLWSLVWTEATSRKAGARHAPRYCCHFV